MTGNAPVESKRSRASVEAGARLLLLCLAAFWAACGRTPAPTTAGDVDHTQMVVAESEPGEPDLGVPGRPSVGATSEQIPVLPDDPRFGNEAAPVTLVAFMDFQCPFCSRVYPTLRALMREYGDHKLRVVFKHAPLPFHEHARAASEAAQVVWELGGANAFLHFADMLFRNQQQLDDTSLSRFAEDAGIATSNLFRRVDEPRTAAKIDADLALADRIGASGTPVFRINGVEIAGAHPIEKFREVIDHELGEARALAASGVRPEQVYARRVAANWVPKEQKKAAARGGEEPPDTTVWKVPIAGSPVRGPPDAPITIVEFGDYQCPFCARVQATLDELEKRYPGKLRWVFKQYPLPFHKHAVPAAMLALEARAEKGDAGFWSAAQRLFETQRELVSDEASDETVQQRLLDLGKELGLNAWRLKTALTKKSHQKVVDGDLDLGDDVKVRGTPHFFVNGKRIAGAKQVDDFARVIDAELVAASERMRARGVSAAKLYDDLMKDAQGAPPPETKSVPAPAKDSPSRGPARAPVVLQVFSDFQCPYCKRLEPTLAELEKAFPGKLRIVWRDLPLGFHKDARPAAAAAREAFAQRGAKGFWRMHDLLFEAQGSGPAGESGLGRARLEALAEQAGLNMARFRAALDAGAHEARIDGDAKVAKDAGISGTPGISINGYFVSGAQSLLKFKKVVRRALDDRKKGKAPPVTPAPPTALRPH